VPDLAGCYLRYWPRSGGGRVPWLTEGRLGPARGTVEMRGNLFGRFSPTARGEWPEKRQGSWRPWPCEPLAEEVLARLGQREAATVSAVG